MFRQVMGHLAHAGAVELAGVGIALSVYATVTKLFNVPLLSVATSTVATAFGEHEGVRMNPETTI